MGVLGQVHTASPTPHPATLQIDGSFRGAISTDTQYQAEAGRSWSR